MSPDLDLGGIMAEHGPSYLLPGYCTADRPPYDRWPCQEYQMAQALSAIESLADHARYVVEIDGRPHRAVLLEDLRECLRHIDPPEEE